jgi:hypothetical protein
LREIADKIIGINFGIIQKSIIGSIHIPTKQPRNEVPKVLRRLKTDVEKKQSKGEA